MSNKDKCHLSEKLIILHLNSSEEEITKKLKAAPLELTIRIAAAIGNVWQQSA
ncbi:MAG: hypothetical protein QNJ53_20570 [Pleurocapsa sp. MO_192.B19]|nr:hypothetical protein [Pleurocapsa sp. MO_192.B19]